jgi:hypothetical protein
METGIPLPCSRQSATRLYSEQDDSANLSQQLPFSLRSTMMMNEELYDIPTINTAAAEHCYSWMA